MGRQLPIRDRDFQTANFAAWLARHAAKIEPRAAMRAEQATKAPWAEAEGESKCTASR